MCSALICSASGVHQRVLAGQSVRALCALRQLCRRAAVVQSRSAAGQAVGGHLSSWQGCVSCRPSAAQRGLACAASAGIVCVHQDAGHRVGWRARATRCGSGVAQRRQAQACSHSSVAAILAFTNFKTKLLYESKRRDNIIKVKAFNSVMKGDERRERDAYRRHPR